jgi:hypothetical protein
MPDEQSLGHHRNQLAIDGGCPCSSCTHFRELDAKAAAAVPEVKPQHDLDRLDRAFIDAQARAPWDVRNADTNPKRGNLTPCGLGTCDLTPGSVHAMDCPKLHGRVAAGDPLHYAIGSGVTVESGDAYMARRREEWRAEGWRASAPPGAPLDGPFAGGTESAHAAQLDRDFTYHAPRADEVEAMRVITAAARHFADVVLSVCPPNADRSAAYRMIREARMTANASLVCDPNRKPD